VLYFGTDPDPRIPNTALRIRILLFSGLEIRDIPNKGRGVVVGPPSTSYFQCCAVLRIRDPRIPNTALRIRIRILLFSGLEIRDIPNKGRGVVVGSPFTSYLKCCNVAAPGSGAFLTPESGSGKEKKSGMNIPDHFSESLETVFRDKNNYRTFFDADPVSEIFLTLDPGWKTSDSG
jgi:hypothetical protein